MGNHITFVDQWIIDFYLNNPGWEMVLKISISLFGIAFLAIIIKKEWAQWEKH